MANTDGKAIAIADLEALGLQMENARIGSDADIQSIGLIDVSNICRNKQQRGRKATTDLSVQSLEISEALEVGGIAVSQHRPQQKPTSVQTTSKVMPLAATMRG